jgi:hypothetical protein
MKLKHLFDNVDILTVSNSNSNTFNKSLSTVYWNHKYGTYINSRYILINGIILLLFCTFGNIGNCINV